MHGKEEYGPCLQSSSISHPTRQHQASTSSTMKIHNTHNVQGSIIAYTCVVETRESGNIFHLVTNSEYIKHSLDDKLGKRQKC